MVKILKQFLKEKTHVDIKNYYQINLCDVRQLIKGHRLLELVD
jgi:hypothetical protein